MSINALRGVAACLWILAPGASLAADDWQPPNLVANPGFEEVAADGKAVGWGNYTTTIGVAHSGERSLCHENTDPGSYVLCSQKIALTPGKAYEVGVWIRTENVEGPETGATLCLEWYGEGGEYLGGHYPAGFEGTHDWQRLTGVSGRVPEGAVNCTVICYLRRGITGKAWWDDVEVRQWRQPPLETMLLKPNYRGEVLPGARQAEVLARLELQDWELGLDDVALRTEVRRRPGGELVWSGIRRPTGAETLLRVSTQGLAAGTYDLRVSVERRDGRAELEMETWRLRAPDPAAPASRPSYIDEHNRLVIDGKPFFPLGMYWGTIAEEELRVYADSAFNCLMPYGAPTQEQMDLAQRLGLKVIYSVKDIYHGSAYCPEDIRTTDDERAFIEAKVEAYRDHPALLAWYLNDELSQEYMPRLEAHQEWLEELDPGHPTWVVLYQVGEVQHYVRTFDVIGTDPYPIPGDAARRAGVWTQRTVDAVRGARPVWMVPQVFNWACYRKTEQEQQALRPPTLPEMRSMTWQCLARGAQGLIYYSWFDIRRDTVVPFEEQWDYVKQVATEVSGMVPVLLSVETAPVFQTRERDWLHWTARKLGETVYLIAVNDEGRRHVATFRLGRAPKRLRLRGAPEPLEPPGDGVLKVELEPFGVGVYEMQF
ncbi:MAG: hypothetical protein FJX74_00595 [Armatimonadetes bacterium]|nr:hypothetical protein [Armatimonadota bacterium]